MGVVGNRRSSSGQDVRHDGRRDAWIDHAVWVFYINLYGCTDMSDALSLGCQSRCTVDTNQGDGMGGQHQPKLLCDCEVQMHRCDCRQLAEFILRLGIARQYGAGGSGLKDGLLTQSYLRMNGCLGAADKLDNQIAAAAFPDARRHKNRAPMCVRCAVNCQRQRGIPSIVTEHLLDRVVEGRADRSDCRSR